jgi:hypothetical protein
MIGATTKKANAVAIVLNDTEQRMLNAFIKFLPKVKPGDARTHLGYQQAHDMLGLSQHGTTPGISLSVQGLARIVEWAQSVNAPAITGIVVD